ncbi:Imelysin [Saccharopolyspora kobensis]|uniref:Imelysin n=1 Tax=Saccharopolyspora kobensis TaxID=146035 RepID=A0A1H5WWB2_9PSEU|nr:imelysin family protein [Saccharopolyspora kobensis]SEG03386.1 Imelysin [Saccharopolyspora kobensis]SFD80072.1 Imelysin [Saccharopolyspora kobensis]
MAIDFDRDSAMKILDALEVLSEDAQAGSRYVSEYTSLSLGDQGLINILSSAHADLATEVNDQMDHIYEYLRTTLSENLADTFALYARIDDEQRGVLLELEEYFSAENNMVERRREAASGEPATGGADGLFTAREDPTSHFVEVTLSSSDSPESSFSPTGVLDIFSITHFVQTICKFFDRDPIEFLGKKLVGDWESFAKCAHAFDNLANGVRAIAQNLRDHVDQLEQAWQGNAYAACNSAVYQAANEMVDGTAVPLESLAEHYREAVEASYQTHKDLEPIIKALIDASTGIGLLKTAGKALKEGGEVLTKHADDAAVRISEFQATLQATKSKLNSISGDFAELKPTTTVPSVLEELEPHARN